MSLVESGYTFTWKIENFSMLPYRPGKYLMSPSFKVNCWDNVEWHLRVYQRGKQVETEQGNLGLYLYMCGHQEITVTFSLEIESIEPPNLKRKHTNNFNKVHHSAGWDEFCILSNDFDKKNIYLPQDVLTIHCHLQPDKEDLNLNNVIEVEGYFIVNSVIRTTIPVNHQVLLWSIKNITKTKTDLKNSIKIPSPFRKSSIENITRRRKYLKTSPFLATRRYSPNFKFTVHLCDISTEEFLSIEIQLIADPLIEIIEVMLVKCKIQVVNSNKEFRDFHESSYIFNSNKDIWNFPPFLKTSNLKRDKYLFVYDTLYLQFQLTYSYPNKEFHTAENYMPLLFETQQTSLTSNLATSVEKYYLNGTLCDIQLLADGEAISAHKLILSARSTVFSAMFENDMREKNSGVVTIDDIDPPTLKRLLSFLYSDILNDDLSTEEVCNLYQAADKYNIEALKQRCSIQMVSCLLVASLCFVLFIADAHQDDFLLDSVQYFIQCNASKVFHSPQWEEFTDSDPKMAAKIMLKNWRH